MSQALKTGLIIVALLLAIAIGGTWYLVQRFGGPIIEQSKMAAQEGETFAQNTDQQGCVTAARTRIEADSNVMAGAFKQGMFLTACLSKSAPTPGFCDNMPESMRSEGAVEWKKVQCAGLQPRDTRCEILAGTVHGYCRNRKSA